MENVKIIELPAFHYINFNGFGKSPELEAIEKLRNWLDQNQTTIGKCRFFGFNNPDPMPGSENYGYEIWAEIPSGKEKLFPDVKFFPGGLYAMLHCSGLLEEADKFIPGSWQKLTAWLESSPYRLGQHQWLEEQLGEDDGNFITLLNKGKMSLDLYMPIVK